MATVIHLLEHTVNPGSEVFDNVIAMILTVDSAVDTSTTLVKARGVTVYNASAGATPNKVMPAGYFDTDRVISTAFATIGDFATFGSMYKQPEVVG